MLIERVRVTQRKTIKTVANGHMITDHNWRGELTLRIRTSEGNKQELVNVTLSPLEVQRLEQYLKTKQVARKGKDQLTDYR